MVAGDLAAVAARRGRRLEPGDWVRVIGGADLGEDERPDPLLWHRVIGRVVSYDVETRTYECRVLFREGSFGRPELTHSVTTRYFSRKNLEPAAGPTEEEAYLWGLWELGG